jgi:hypothetical protein
LDHATAPSLQVRLVPVRLQCEQEACGTADMSLTGAGSADSHVISYRPDIDGLRAIAVLSVIAYHMRRGALPHHLHHLGRDPGRELLAGAILRSARPAHHAGTAALAARGNAGRCRLAAAVGSRRLREEPARNLGFCRQCLLLARHELLCQGSGGQASLASVVSRRRGAILHSVSADSGAALASSAR